MERTQRPYKTLAIRTAKGPLEGTFQIIVPFGVIALVEGGSPKTYHIGTVFDRNRANAQTSPKGTEWTAHEEGIYDGDRSALQKLSHYGADHGEIVDLLGDGRVITAYVDGLQHLAVFGEKEMSLLRAENRRIIGRLSRARVPKKQRAFQDLVRASCLTDRRGRSNTGAATMAGYAGRYQVRLRIDDIRKMIPYLDTRAIRIRAFISDIICAFEELLDLLGARHQTRPRRKPEIWDFIVHPSHPTRRTAMRLIDEQKRVFSHVRVEPFLKNVRHLLDDLDTARTILASPAIVQSPGDIVLLRQRFLRMRQGIAWALALHFLEMEIRTPLSLLVGDVRRVVTAKSAVVGGSDGTEVVMSGEDEKRFEAIRARIAQFNSRVVRCSDSYLGHPVKQDVTARLEEVLRYVDRNDWTMAREELEILAGIL